MRTTSRKLRQRADTAIRERAHATSVGVRAVGIPGGRGGMGSGPSVAAPAAPMEAATAAKTRRFRARRDGDGRADANVDAAAAAERRMHLVPTPICGYD
eukprot:ctg_377.g235